MVKDSNNKMTALGVIIADKNELRAIYRNSLDSGDRFFDRVRYIWSAADAGETLLLVGFFITGSCSFLSLAYLLATSILLIRSGVGSTLTPLLSFIPIVVFVAVSMRVSNSQLLRNLRKKTSGRTLRGSCASLAQEAFESARRFEHLTKRLPENTPRSLRG